MIMERDFITYFYNTFSLYSIEYNEWLSLRETVLVYVVSECLYVVSPWVRKGLDISRRNSHWT